ncbi:MAG: M20/M25/M40 family metallo-hydrolase, partial [Elusimicrobia bacterium]|nr:M20/M25/M40 family metallo-hydrolase [Elusimicrobiota bacterium]
PAAAVPLAAAPVLAPALAASPAASAPTPLEAAKALGARLAASPAQSAPALSAAFDGRMAAPSVPVDAAPAAPLTPEQFAARAESLFTAGRLAPGQRAAVAYRDAVRPAGVLPTDDELKERMARSPLTNAEREKTVVDLFKLAGAKESDIVVQDIGRGKHNFIVTKKGKSDRVIVVGGHHDKVSEGAGTIDNWTGATLVTNLYQALRDADTDATIVFVAFGREEEGLLGSQAYLDSLTAEQKKKIDAMVNLDTLAVDGTYSWKNNSTRALLDRVAKAAKENGRDLKEAYLDGGDADSSSFRQAGIPAVTIYGASMDVIFDIIHSERDTMAAFDFKHYKNAYLLVVDVLKSLDREKLGPVGRGKV